MKGTYSGDEDLFSFDYSLYVDYDNDKIVNIVDGTKVSDIVSKVYFGNSKSSVMVTNKKNEVKSTNDLIFTGDILVINDKYKYELSVIGDSDGEGTVDLQDLLLIRRQIVGWINPETGKKFSQKGVYYDSIDMNRDGYVDLLDLLLMRKKIVNSLDVYFVRLSDNKLNLAVNESYQLKYSVIYDVPSASATWKSSDTSVVKVDSSGKVTAVGIGNATVTANVGGITASCNVYVESSSTVYDRIHFISNGNAFSTFLSSGDVDGKNTGPSPSEVILLESQGKFALIDSGLHNNHGDSLNEGRTDYVIEYLKKVGVKELEFMLITHVHYDHMGGATTIIKNVKTKKLYAKPYYGDESTNDGKRWATLYDEAYTKQNIYQKINSDWENRQIELGNMDLFLYNTKNLQYYQACSEEDENINSIMTYITVNGRKIFLTGDMEKPSDASCKGVYNGTCDATSKTCSSLGCTKSSITACIVSEYNIENLDLFKLPHHGYGSCDVDGITMKSDGTLVATNWEDKVGYYYSGITVNGSKVGPVYNSSSCRAKYFSSYTTENKRLYYVENRNLIFDFTNGDKKIYNN